MQNDQIVPVTQESIDKAKKWALIKFREMLRGAKITEQMKRYLSGELERSYRFQVEIAMDEKMTDFIDDPRNREVLNQERLLPTLEKPA